MDTNPNEYLKKISEDIKTLTESHNQLKSEMRASCKASSDALCSIKDFSKKISAINGEINSLRHTGRQNNILMFNLKENLQNNSDLISTVSKIFEKINIVVPDLAFADAFRIGSTENNRPILVKFIAPRWVRVVFSKVKEFRNIGLSISNDR